MTTYTDLPTAEAAGERAAWVLPVGRSGGTHTVNDATFLGYGSTERSRHKNHDGSEFAPQGVKCPACRWYESRLFKLHPPASAGTGTDNGSSRRQHYLIHHVGASNVPGEVDLCRYEETYSAHGVVEAFTVRPHSGKPFLTRPGALVLAGAAAHDNEVETAWVNRAVE